MAEIQSLNPRHYRMLDLFAGGKSNKEVAELVELSEQQVSIIVNSPSFQHELSIRRASLENRIDEGLSQQVVQPSERQEEVDKILREGTVAAAEKLKELVGNQNAAVSRLAANDLLDRTGHPRVNRLDRQAVGVVVLTQKDVDRLVDTVKLDEDTVVITDAKED